MKKCHSRSLYLKTINRQYIYSSTETQKLYLFERNNAGLKKLVKFCLERQVTHLPS
jgi:hypothetical protein